MRNLPPRDGIAATHLWVPVDATGDDFYSLGSRFGTQVGVLHELHDETGHPYATNEGAGFFDPRSLRYHRLQRQTSMGDEDNRLAVQILNDYEAEYQDARTGDAPFGQSEYFTSLNRTTREADSKGRVALPSSHRRVIDSEDDRYAVALTCRSVALEAAEIEIPVGEDVTVAGQPVPDGVHFREPGSDSVAPGSSSYGGVTTTAPSVSVGGVTFFGGAAVQAARNAIAQGGSAADAARAASAAARGLPPPPLLDADNQTHERPKQGGATQAQSQPPPPDLNPGGSVPLLNHPKGYVWSEAGRIGLLGTLVAPEGAGGSYFAGREGTPIGPLPIRHDGQFTMGPELVGRIVFVSNDASEVEEGTGKPIKGELWGDRNRANQDTELGLETLQWRPVIRVDADLPPSRPPPPWLPPPWIQPPPKKKKKPPKKKPPQKPGGGGKPPGSGKPPGDKPEPGDGPGLSGGILVGGGAFTPIPVPPKRETPDGSVQDGELQPVGNPGSQTRDYDGPGEPCPNSTAGVLVGTGGTMVATGTPPSVGGLPVIPVPGGFIEFFGYPAITPVPGGLIVGGEESPKPIFGLPTPPGRGVRVDPAPGPVPHGAPVPGDDPGRIPLGLPGPQGGGIRVDPGPDDGVPRGRRVPGDDQGRIPLGLPVRPGGPGIGFGPPLGGDDGIPRGYEERLDRARRRARARQAREEYERREQERIDELKDLEERARDAGRDRLARRVQRARERMERRRQKRQDRRQRREDYRERKRREREERRRRREERRAERRRKRDERRRRRARERQARRERGDGPSRPPQGGYMIDVSDPAAEAHSIGRLTESERKQLEEDRRREEETRRRYQEEVAGFGHWNAANMPLPFFGSPGGPRSLEDWAHLATYQVQAMQRVVNGAFGGPSYLAGNIGVVHRNRPGNPPAGSRIGVHWTAFPHEPLLKITRGQAPLEVISVLEAPAGTVVDGCAGGVLEVVREHRGEGLVLDHRPLILLENARSNSPSTVRADMISDVARRFYVAAGAEVTGSKLRAYCRPGEAGKVLEIGRTDPETGEVVEHLVFVDLADGVLVARRGVLSKAPIRLEGEASIVLAPQPAEIDVTFAIEATPDATVRIGSSNEEIPVRLEVQGSLGVAGDALIGGKLFVAGSIDPTDLQLTPQPRNPVPMAAHGLWVSDGTEPGTVKGGLYYERGGKRIRLDTP